MADPRNAYDWPRGPKVKVRKPNAGSFTGVRQPSRRRLTDLLAPTTSAEAFGVEQGPLATVLRLGPGAGKAEEPNPFAPDRLAKPTRAATEPLALAAPVPPPPAPKPTRGAGEYDIEGAIISLNLPTGRVLTPGEQAALSQQATYWYEAGQPDDFGTWLGSTAPTLAGSLGLGGWLPTPNWGAIRTNKQFASDFSDVRSSWLKFQPQWAALLNDPQNSAAIRAAWDEWNKAGRKGSFEGYLKDSGVLKPPAAVPPTPTTVPTGPADYDVGRSNLINNNGYRIDAATDALLQKDYAAFKAAFPDGSTNEWINTIQTRNPALYDALEASKVTAAGAPIAVMYEPGAGFDRQAGETDAEYWTRLQGAGLSDAEIRKAFADPSNKFKPGDDPKKTETNVNEAIHRAYSQSRLAGLEEIFLQAETQKRQAAQTAGGASAQLMAKLERQTDRDAFAGSMSLLRTTYVDEASAIAQQAISAAGIDFQQLVQGLAYLPEDMRTMAIATVIAPVLDKIVPGAGAKFTANVEEWQWQDDAEGRLGTWAEEHPNARYAQLKKWFIDTVKTDWMGRAITPESADFFLATLGYGSDWRV